MHACACERLRMSGCVKTYVQLTSNYAFDCVAVCGNGRCEFGESAALCSADCPVGIQSCPYATVATTGNSSSASSRVTCAGHGTCMPSSGTCSCFRGYVGSACDRCDSEHVTSADGACTFLPGALSSCSDGVQNGNEAGIDCGGPCPSCTSTRKSPTKVISIAVVVGGSLIVVVVSAVTAVIVRRQQSKRARVEDSKLPAATSTSRKTVDIRTNVPFPSGSKALQASSRGRVTPTSSVRSVSVVPCGQVLDESFTTSRSSTPSKLRSACL